MGGNGLGIVVLRFDVFLVNLDSTIGRGEIFFAPTGEAFLAPSVERFFANTVKVIIHFM